MLKRIGRKLVQGAKAEVEADPDLMCPGKILELAEAGLSLLLLGLMIFASSRSSTRAAKLPASITIINNYYKK